MDVYGRQILKSKVVEPQAVEQFAAMYLRNHDDQFETLWDSNPLSKAISSEPPGATT